MSSPQSKGWAGGLSEFPEIWADAVKTKNPPGHWSKAQIIHLKGTPINRVGYFLEGMLARVPKRVSMVSSGDFIVFPLAVFHLYQKNETFRDGFESSNL